MWGGGMWGGGGGREAHLSTLLSGVFIFCCD